jgi:hypothetical protein
VAITDENKVKAMFNNPITITANLENYVPREDVEIYLKEILTPKRAQNMGSFWGNSTGKTTIVQKVCNNIGKGIIYVDVPYNAADFKNSFAKALGLTHRHNGGLLTWGYAYEEFKKFAEWYRRENSKAPVIVFDNIDRLADQAPEILAVLQEDAKSAVDSGLFNSVFLTSDNATRSQMQGKMRL